MSKKLDPKLVQDLIRQWLYEEEFKIQSITDPKAHFNILAEDKYNKKVNIAQPKIRKDQITINAAAKLLESQKEELVKMDEQERNKLFWQMRLSLINKNVGFSPIKLPLDHVRISQGIYYDGLTKDAFFQRMFVVRRTLLLVMWMIERALGVGEPSEILQDFEESLFYVS